jgi:lipopolysaccharide export LptBFGC system permease protein LptF
MSNVQNTRLNQKKLLKKQQISQDKINQLLELSSQELICGPDCQQKKISTELKQKYLDAQTNLQTAPINLENTKKNYYVYSEGLPFYDNMREEELQQKADTISTLVSENFNSEVSDANVMNLYLNTALINSKYTAELLEDYLEKNTKLKLQLKDRYGDILTNDRKTYYETDALNTLTFWYKLFWYIYYVLVIMLILAFIFSSTDFSRMTKIIISVFIIFYTYYIDYIVRWIYGLWKSLVSRLPKNVYNNL